MSFKAVAEVPLRWSTALTNQQRPLEVDAHRSESPRGARKTAPGDDQLRCGSSAIERRGVRYIARLGLWTSATSFHPDFK